MDATDKLMRQCERVYKQCEDQSLRKQPRDDLGKIMAACKRTYDACVQEGMDRANAEQSHQQSSAELFEACSVVQKIAVGMAGGQLDASDVHSLVSAAEECKLMAQKRMQGGNWTKQFGASKGQRNQDLLAQAKLRNAAGNNAAGINGGILGKVQKLNEAMNGGNSSIAAVNGNNAAAAGQMNAQANAPLNSVDAQLAQAVDAINSSINSAVNAAMSNGLNGPIAASNNNKPLGIMAVNDIYSRNYPVQKGMRRLYGAECSQLEPCAMGMQPRSYGGCTDPATCED